MESPKNSDAPTMPDEQDRHARARLRPPRQRHQRQRAAFALVVGPQHEGHVFDRDDEGECPHDQRQDAQYLAAHHDAVSRRGVQRLAEGVDRAGADVAEHHAQRAEHEHAETGLFRGLFLLGLAVGRLFGCWRGAVGHDLPFFAPHRLAARVEQPRARRVASAAAYRPTAPRRQAGAVSRGAVLFPTGPARPAATTTKHRNMP